MYRVVILEGIQWEVTQEQHNLKAVTLEVGILEILLLREVILEVHLVGAILAALLQEVTLEDTLGQHLNLEVTLDRHRRLEAIRGQLRNQVAILELLHPNKVCIFLATKNEERPRWLYLNLFPQATQGLLHHRQDLILLMVSLRQV